MIVGDYLIEYRNVSFGEDHSWYPLPDDLFLRQGNYETRARLNACETVAPFTTGTEGKEWICIRGAKICAADNEHVVVINGARVAWKR